MPDQKTKAKLSAEQQLRVCALLAMGYVPERICQTFLDDYEITITPTNIRVNYQKSARWKKIIARMQREAERRILQEPLAIKVNRIKFLTEAANEAMTWRLERINYDRQGNETSRIEKRHIGVIPAITKELRAEIEGDKPGAVIDQSLKINIVQQIRQALEKDAESKSDSRGVIEALSPIPT